MQPAQRKRIDKAMLESLAASFRMSAAGYPFVCSFNHRDVADLMVRCAGLMEPTLVEVLNAEPPQDGGDVS